MIKIKKVGQKVSHYDKELMIVLRKRKASK